MFNANFRSISAFDNKWQVQ